MWGQISASNSRGTFDARGIGATDGDTQSVRSTSVRVHILHLSSKLGLYHSHVVGHMFCFVLEHGKIQRTCRDLHVDSGAQH